MKVSSTEDKFMDEFKKVSDCYQAIKNDRKKLNSLISLVEIFEKVTKYTRLNYLSFIFNLGRRFGFITSYLRSYCKSFPSFGY